MIVTCSECSTSFQLDEARIPPTGAQVRCSRCKHAFFLPHPSESQTEAVHGIAEQAAADPSAGVPSASADLAGPGEPEEEEWQFSEEVRVEGDEELAEPSALDEASDFGLGEDFGEGLDADSLSEDVVTAEADAAPIEGPAVSEMAADDDGGSSGLELDGPPESSEVARDESSFGSVDDFSSLMEDDEPAGESLGAESTAAIERPPVESPGSYSSAEATDDLGDPESWDLIGGAPASAAPPRARRKASSVPSTAGAALDGALAELSFSPDEDSLAYEEEREPSVIASAFGKFGHLVGWVVTLAALAVVTGLLVGPEFSRWAIAPQSSAFGSLRAETTEMHWMETARSGFVLVMQGEVENTGTSAVVPSNVRLWLLDGGGERLTAAPLPVGFPLEEEALREAGQAALREQLSASSSAFVSRPLAPGESRAFQSVLLEDALPGRARRILLEVADPNAEVPVAAQQVNSRALARPEAQAGDSDTAGQEAQAGSVEVRSAVPGANTLGAQDGAPRVSDLLDLDD